MSRLVLEFVKENCGAENNFEARVLITRTVWCLIFIMTVLILTCNIPHIFKMFGWV